MPEWKQELGAHVFQAVIFPARWSGPAAIFVGGVSWAVLPSVAFAVLWRRVHPGRDEHVR